MEGFVYVCDVHCFLGVLCVVHCSIMNVSRVSQDRIMRENRAGIVPADAALSPTESLEKRVELQKKYNSVLEAFTSQDLEKAER